MKTLYFISGTMGVGKSAVCRELQKQLDNSVFLDGDWCWDASPFQVTEETKRMVTDNICHVLNNFLRCSAYDNIIFCWVMHQQAILDDILSRLDTGGCRVKNVSLLAGEDTLRARLQGDVARGIRTGDVIDRSVARLPLYRELNTVKVDTDGKPVAEIAREIIAP